MTVRPGGTDVVVVLDEIDCRLVRGLVADGRASFTSLGKLVSLSSAAVRTRVQRLLEEHVVVVTGRVDPRALGLGVFSIAFVTSKGPARELAHRIAHLEDAPFVSTMAGPFDLLVELRCRDSDHLLASLDGLRSIDGVSTVESCTMLRYLKQDWTRVGDATASPPEPMKSPTVSTDLDATDVTLIRQLVTDGRVSFARLAPLVGLSQAAVRARVVRLFSDNVLSVQTHSQPYALGIRGFGGVGVVTQGPARSVAETIVGIPETTLVAATSGRYDVLVEFWYRDEEQLLSILDRVRAHPGVRSIESMFYLTVEKEDFSYGLTQLDRDHTKETEANSL